MEGLPGPAGPQGPPGAIGQKGQKGDSGSEHNFMDYLSPMLKLDVKFTHSSVGLHVVVGHGI